MFNHMVQYMSISEIVNRMVYFFEIALERKS